MKTTEFIAEIRRRTDCDSPEAALRASRATLITLGERLPGDQPCHLAAQLPPEIGRFLLAGDVTRGEPLSPAEFLRRVSEREGVDLQTARAHARAVVEVLHQAVCEAERRALH